MSRVNLTFVLLLAVLAAGCAGGRDNLDAAPPEPATPLAAADESASGQPTVVDGNQLAQREVPICREVLRNGSNVHVRQCMSATDWKRWERQEADRAEATVRALQGSGLGP